MLNLVDHNWNVDADGYGRLIYSATMEGMWPFKPKKIVVESVFDIDYLEQKIIVEAHFETCFFPVELRFDAENMFKHGIEVEVERLAQLTTHTLRNRPRVSSDHGLGEE